MEIVTDNNGIQEDGSRIITLPVGSVAIIIGVKPDADSATSFEILSTFEKSDIPDHVQQNFILFATGMVHRAVEDEEDTLHAGFTAMVKDQMDAKIAASKPIGGDISGDNVVDFAAYLAAAKPAGNA